MPKYNLTEPVSTTSVVIGTVDGVKRLSSMGHPGSRQPWVLDARDGYGPVWHTWERLLEYYDSEPEVLDVDARPAFTPEQEAALKTLHALGPGDMGVYMWVPVEKLQKAFPLPEVHFEWEDDSVVLVQYGSSTSGWGAVLRDEEGKFDGRTPQELESKFQVERLDEHTRNALHKTITREE